MTVLEVVVHLYCFTVYPLYAFLYVTSVPVYFAILSVMVIVKDTSMLIPGSMSDM